MDFSNPALVAAIQGKLQSLIGRDSGYIKSLPKEVKRRVNALKNLQSKQAELESKLQEEILALERKYHALYEPLYDKRLEFTSGKVEPTDEEATLEDEDGEETEEAAAAAPSNDAPPSNEEAPKGIPQFWLTAMQTHPQLAELITEDDEEALKHLTDIRFRDLEDNPGFKLEFYFEPNDFFSDSVLTKTYYLANEDNEIVYDHAEGTKIQWKEEKDLTIKVETKKQRHKGTNKTRIVKKTVPAETFFNFFSPPKMPEEADEDADEQEMEELQDRLEADYAAGEIIKEKIIPHAVDWFTGEALAYDMDDEYGSEGDYSDDDDEGSHDDEDEDDEEDDEDEPPKKGSKANKP